MKKSQQDSSRIGHEVRTRIEELVLEREKQDKKHKKPSRAAKQDSPGCTSAGHRKAGGWSGTGDRDLHSVEQFTVSSGWDLGLVGSVWTLSKYLLRMQEPPVLHPGAPQPLGSAEDRGELGWHGWYQ